MDDDGRPKSAFERMIGRRTAPRTGVPGGPASPSYIDPMQFEAPDRPGPSPRQNTDSFSGGGGGGGGSARSRGSASSGGRGFAFPSEPVGGYPSYDGASNSTPMASPSQSRRGARGAAGRGRRGGGGGMDDFAALEDSDGDLELQPGTWAEDAVEELYGCDPSAAYHYTSPGARPAPASSSSFGGGAPRSRGGSSRGADSPYADADEDGYALPSPGRPPSRRGDRGGGGGGGGKTRTRCRALGGTDPMADPANRGRTAFAAPPQSSLPSSSAGIFSRPGTTLLSSISTGGPKNKRLQRKSAQSLPLRRRSDMQASRRGRGDTSDDSDDAEFTAEVYFVAPSPAAGPARAPQIPGEFVLPLQADVEESTELLFMHFELC